MQGNQGQKGIFRSVLSFILLCTLSLSAYIVKKGDTLWDLSEEFFQDPFQWPGIWENNPHIENPHLIYPGDSLNMDGSASTAATSITPAQEVPKSIATTSPFLPDSLLPKGVINSERAANFQAKLGGLKSNSSVYDNLTVKPTKFVPTKVKKVPYLNRHYQIHAPRATPELSPNWGKWIDIESGVRNAHPRARVGDEILLQSGKSSTTMKVGDHVYLFTSKALKLHISDEKMPVEYFMHELCAVAQIKDVGLGKTRAILSHMFTSFEVEDSRALTDLNWDLIKVKGFEKVTNVEYETLAEIVWIQQDANITQNHAYALINRGVAAGYNKGDGVVIWEDDFEDEQLAPRMLGRGIIVNSAENFSTILIRDILNAHRIVETSNLVSVNYRALK